MAFGGAWNFFLDCQSKKNGEEKLSLGFDVPINLSFDEKLTSLQRRVKTSSNGKNTLESAHVFYFHDS